MDKDRLMIASVQVSASFCSYLVYEDVSGKATIAAWAVSNSSLFIPAIIRRFRRMVSATS